MYLFTHTIICSLILSSAFYRTRFLGLQGDRVRAGTPRSPSVSMDCLAGLRATRAGSVPRHHRPEQLLFYSRCTMQMPFLLPPKFMYPGACRVYDFSLFYFCCRVFSRPSQPCSQSSQQLRSPGHSQACNPSRPGLLWSKLSHFPRE